MKKQLKLFVAMILTAVFMTACGRNIQNVPPGYIAKKLNPTGWEKGLYEAGQVDIGDVDGQGRSSSLVLLEATSVTHKESFQKDQKSEDGAVEDHRIVTKKHILVAVDIYCQLVLPPDEKTRDAVFALVTPEEMKDNDRVKIIHLYEIYKSFARMGIRGKTRALLAKYEDDMDILAHAEEINQKLSKIFADTFSENHVPLLFRDVQISNVKVDEAIWGAQQRNAAASSEVDQINSIGAALKANPEYLQFMKWKSLKDIAEVGSANGTNTVIITDSVAPSVTVPVPQNDKK